MKILVLSQWYPPEPQSVVSDLAETLAAGGHDVTVLTGFPNFPSGKLYPGYSLKFVQREIWNGIPIVRVPLLPYHGRSPILRILNLMSFCAAAILIGPWFVRRPDLIHAIQPPTTCFPAWVLSRVWRAPFTYEVQDLWPDTLRATGMVSAGRALRLVERYCRWAYRKAAAIRVISEGFRGVLLSRGVPEGKVHFLPNWVDTDRYKPLDPADATPAWDTGRPAFRIVYAGNMGLAQGLDNVLQAAARLPAAAPVRFVLIGDGVEAETLRSTSERMGLSNVEFVPFRQPEEMPAILAAADAVLLHLKCDPLFSVTIPHKLLTYLAVGKPVLACADGEPAAIVRSAEAGVACPPGDPAALAAAALELAGLSAARRAEMGRAGRVYACARFERTAVVSRIGRMLETAAFPASV
jgi:glycosyltransferase involved in cell wall biosynthesis